MSVRTWTINKLPMTNNERIRCHWGKRRKEAKMWALLVRCICGEAEPRPVKGKCSVTITMYRKRLQDPDNAAGSVKPVLDALVRCKWLRDDSPEYLSLDVVEKRDKDQRTVIEWSPDTLADWAVL